MKTIARASLLVGLSCLIIQLPSCTELDTQDTSADHGTVPAAKLLDFPQPDVLKKQFTCVFDTTPHYLQGTSGGGSAKALVSYASDVNAAALVTKIEAITVANGEKRGMVVHYGMEDPTNTDELKMVFGLELVKLVPAGDHWLGAYWRTEPVANSFLDVSLNPVDKTTWLAQYAANYKAWVRIRRTNQNKVFSTFVQDQDVERYTFFHENAIASFVQQNPGMVNIRIHALAEPTLRELSGSSYEETGWRQIICLVGHTSTGDPMLDNTITNGSPFLNKGLDLGSPCPPLCKGAVFIKEGMPIHPDCP